MKVNVTAVVLRNDKLLVKEDIRIRLVLNGEKILLKPREEKTVFIKESYDDLLIQFEELAESIVNKDKTVMLMLYKHMLNEYTGPYILARRFHFEITKSTELLDKGVLADILVTAQRGKRVTGKGKVYMQEKIREIEHQLEQQ